LAEANGNKNDFNYYWLKPTAIMILNSNYWLKPIAIKMIQIYLLAEASFANCRWLQPTDKK